MYAATSKQNENKGYEPPAIINSTKKSKVMPEFRKRTKSQEKEKKSSRKQEILSQIN